MLPEIAHAKSQTITSKYLYCGFQGDAPKESTIPLSHKAASEALLGDSDFIRQISGYRSRLIITALIHHLLDAADKTQIDEAEIRHYYESNQEKFKRSLADVRSQVVQELIYQKNMERAIQRHKITVNEKVLISMSTGLPSESSVPPTATTTTNKGRVP